LKYILFKKEEDDDKEKKMNSLSLKHLNNNDSVQSAKKTVHPSQKEVFVKKWIDYSDKYGIGYLLSNGMYGVYFNDTSNIVMGGNASKIYYIEKKAPENKNQVLAYTLDIHPIEISKKVKLFQYFQGYLNPKGNEHENVEEINESNIIYLRFWIKKSRCLMFILSTKNIQVNRFKNQKNY